MTSDVRFAFLPEDTDAACIGASFDFETLANKEKEHWVPAFQ